MSHVATTEAKPYCSRLNSILHLLYALFTYKSSAYIIWWGETIANSSFFRSFFLCTSSSYFWCWLCAMCALSLFSYFSVHLNYFLPWRFVYRNQLLYGAGVYIKHNFERMRQICSCAINNRINWHARRPIHWHKQLPKAKKIRRTNLFLAKKKKQNIKEVKKMKKRNAKERKEK